MQTAFQNEHVLFQTRFGFQDDYKGRGAAKLMVLVFEFENHKPLRFPIKFCSRKRVTSSVRCNGFELVPRALSWVDNFCLSIEPSQGWGNFIRVNTGEVNPRRPCLIICDHDYRLVLTHSKMLPYVPHLKSFYVEANEHAVRLRQKPTIPLVDVRRAGAKSPPKAKPLAVSKRKRPNDDSPISPPMSPLSPAWSPVSPKPSPGDLSPVSSSGEVSAKESPSSLEWMSDRDCDVAHILLQLGSHAANSRWVPPQANVSKTFE